MLLPEEASVDRLICPTMHSFRTVVYRLAVQAVELWRERFFSTKVCDIGLKFGGKSNCSSNTQTSQTRPIIHAVRSSITYSICTWCEDSYTEQLDASSYVRKPLEGGWITPKCRSMLVIILEKNLADFSFIVLEWGHVNIAVRRLRSSDKIIIFRTLAPE